MVNDMLVDQGGAENFYFNPDLSGGTDIISGVGTPPDEHAIANNTGSLTAVIIGTNPTYDSNAANELGRLVFREVHSTTEFTHGARYEFSADVWIDGYDGSSTEMLRGININNNAALIINRDNADHSGANQQWERLSVLFDVIGDSDTLYFAHNVGVINESNLRHQTRNLSIREVIRNTCNTYLFSDANPDSIAFDTPFTGNLKAIIAAESEAGINADLIAGRIGEFIPSPYPLNNPQWMYYEADVNNLTDIFAATFNGVVGYIYKDDVEHPINMGVDNSLPYNHMLYLGASIMYGAFDEADRITTATTPFFEDSGLSGTNYYAYTNPGTNSIGYLSLANQFFADNPSLTGRKLVVVHGSGGDVTNLRPYDTADQGDLDAVESNLEALFQQFQAEGFDILYMGATYRQYTDVPPDSNGSLPFNENMFYPLLQTYSSDYWDSSLSKPVCDVYGMSETLGDAFFADTVHPYSGVGDYIFNSYVNTQVVRRLNNQGTYNYSGKKLITCWNAGSTLATANLTTDSNISRMVNTYNANGDLTGRAGCSGIFDSNKERTPLTVIMNTYKQASSGRGNPLETGYTLDSDEVLQGYVYTLEDDMQDGRFWLGGTEYAGLTGTISFIASRNSTGSNRKTQVTVQGSLPKVIDAELDESCSFPFTVDSDGLILFQYGKSDITQSAGYISGIELSFD